jgi:hypothetical protein
MQANSIVRWLLMGMLAVGTLFTLGRGLMARPTAASGKWPHPPVQSDGFAESLAALNRAFKEHWDAEGVQPAAPAAWQTVARRASLGLIGNGLSLDELRQLERFPEATRVARWTEHLLVDQRWSDYFAQRLSRSWVGNEEGPLLAFRRRKFETWISEELRGGAAYDQLVHKLIASNGLFTDQPAVNFLSATLNATEDGRADPIKLTARTARSMLAVRIDCLQCHDDMLGNVHLGEGPQYREGQQVDFHQLAAFYGGVSLNPLIGMRDDDRPYRIKLLDQSEETTIVPGVPFGKDYFPEHGAARERLAKWITSPKNRQAARAAVNRLWALVTGKPLVEPVDNIPLNMSVPRPLDVLADDFVAHRFNIQRLVRLIVASDAFHCDSRLPDREVTAKEESAWAVYPLVRLRPEQVAASIIQASRLSAIDGNASVLTKLVRFGEMNDFLTRYGDSGEDQFTQDSVTVVQRLMLMNGKMVSDRTNDELTSPGKQVAVLSNSTTKAIETCYLAVLNRLPSDREREHFRKRIDQPASDTTRDQAIEDLYWVLLNSSELTWNH